MNEKKLHVLVIPAWYPCGEDKLIGVYHKVFCNALAKQGKCKVNMLYLDRQRISKPLSYLSMTKTFVDKYEGYDVYGFKMMDISKISFDAEINKYTRKLFSAYKKYENINGKPDVIHAQVAVPTGYACCMLGEKIGVPVVLTEHATYFERFFTGASAKYSEKVLNSAKITCVGEFMVNIYAKKGVKASVLPNIVDCSTFTKRTKAKVTDTFNLVTACALRDGKGIHIAVDAIKKLVDVIPGIHYTVIGDGELEAFYKEHTKKADMDKYVTFVGRKNVVEISKIFQSMNAMVVATDIETFGIPAVEALAAGLPVVSTRNYGTESFLDKKCSVMCNVGDADDLARAIKEMYDRYDEFDPEYAAKVASQFDGPCVANTAYGYYLDVIKQAK